MTQSNLSGRVLFMDLSKSIKKLDRISKLLAELKAKYEP